MIGSEDVRSRFDAETASVRDPDSTPIGEVIRPSESVDDGYDFDVSEFVTDELVGVILAMPGGIMARKTGHEFWEADQDEREILGKAAGPAVRFLAQKYLNGSAGPWGMIGAAIGVVYGPKMMQEMMERREEKLNPNRQQDRQRSTDASAASSGRPDQASQQSSSDFAVPYDDL